jgi:hypothetical protein
MGRRILLFLYFSCIETKQRCPSYYSPRKGGDKRKRKGVSLSSLILTDSLVFVRITSLLMSEGEEVFAKLSILPHYV